MGVPSSDTLVTEGHAKEKMNGDQKNSPNWEIKLLTHFDTIKKGIMA